MHMNFQCSTVRVSFKCLSGIVHSHYSYLSYEAIQENKIRQCYYDKGTSMKGKLVWSAKGAICLQRKRERWTRDNASQGQVIWIVWWRDGYFKMVNGEEPKGEVLCGTWALPLTRASASAPVVFSQSSCVGDVWIPSPFIYPESPSSRSAYCGTITMSIRWIRGKRCVKISAFFMKLT